MKSRICRASALLAVFACASSLSSVGMAQTPPASLPTREQLEPTVENEAVGKPGFELDSTALTAPCPLAESALTAAITSVQFTGADGAALQPEVAKLLSGIQPQSGQQPLSQICRLRDEANAALSRANLLAMAIIPEQELKDGALHLEVVTGRITAVTVQGDAGRYGSLIAARVAELQRQSPVDTKEVERILLLGNEVPGLQMALALAPAPSGVKGEMVGVLRVDYRPVRLLFNARNYNSTTLGREMLYARGEFNGLTGFGDVTYLAFGATADFDEQILFQAGHETRLGSSGLTLGLSGTYARSRPELGGLDLVTDSYVEGLDLSYPLIRRPLSGVTLQGGFEHAVQRSVVNLEGDVPLSRDRISVLYARLTGNALDLRPDGKANYAMSGFVEARRGLDIFGATRALTVDDGFTPSRIEGDSVATVLRAKADVVIAPASVFELMGSVRGQLADRPLLNYDEFSVGNLTTGRGYDPGANSGDRGVGFTLEPRVNVALGGNNRAQFYGFYDGAQIANLDRQTTEESRYLSSLGGGVRFSLSNALQLDVTYAHPLDKALSTDADKPTDRLLLSLTLQHY